MIKENREMENKEEVVKEKSQLDMLLTKLTDVASQASNVNDVAVLVIRAVGCISVILNKAFAY